MNRAARIVCECGGELPRPMPLNCPHCGAVISSVRRRRAPLLVQAIIIVTTFAALIAYLMWLLSR